MDGWRIHKALRLIAIVGTPFGLMYLGLEGMQGAERNMFAGLLVVIGAVAVGMWLAKEWAEPKQPK
jgi:hypothetical protein